MCDVRAHFRRVTACLSQEFSVIIAIQQLNPSFCLSSFQRDLVKDYEEILLLGYFWRFVFLFVQTLQSLVLLLHFLFLCFLRAFVSLFICLWRFEVRHLEAVIFF